MTVNAMELALWTAYTNKDASRHFVSERDSYLDQFELDHAERQLILDSDVMGQINHGANSLLVMMAWQVLHGMENVPQYFELVNRPQPAA